MSNIFVFCFLVLVSEITDIFTVKQLKESMSSMTSTVQYGIVYGFISWFDIDSEHKNLIRLRWYVVFFFIFVLIQSSQVKFLLT